MFQPADVFEFWPCGRSAPRQKGRTALAESDSPKISVVIPVYNVEKYLGKCLVSLTEQTWRDFEVIAVNDGSTDSSPDILRHFAEKYDYIRVIHQKNAGVSQARNTALAAARGEYLAFVDSDDYVAPTFLEELYHACADNGADISCCYYYFHFIENDFLFEYPFRSKGVLTGAKAMDKLLRDVQIQSLLWNKMFRRSLFVETGVTFPSMCFEDLAVLNQVFAKAKRVAVIDRPLYYYNQHSSSTLATINANKINDFIRAIAMVRISLEKNGLYEKYKKSYLALTRKTANCCYLYVLQMHGKKKCMHGAMENMRRISNAIRRYSGDELSPSLMKEKVPDVVSTPEKMQKDLSLR